MSNSAGSGSTNLKAFCSTVFELNDLLRFMKLSKQILYENKKHEGSILQGFEHFGFDPTKHRSMYLALSMCLFPRVFLCTLSQIPV